MLILVFVLNFNLSCSESETSKMLSYLSILILVIIGAHLCMSLFTSRKQSQLVQARLTAEAYLMEQEVNKLVNEAQLRERESDSWFGWRKFRVSEIHVENDTVKSFYLIPHDGKTLPTYLPGQHLTFRLKVPGQSKPIVRCYSLSDDGNKTSHYRVSIRRQPAPKGSKDMPDGLSSCFFHDQVEANDILDVKAPAGKFYLDINESTPIALVGGGIGLTPSLSMLNTLASSGSKRQVFLFYAVRDINDLIMAKHFTALEQTMAHLKVHYFFADLDQKLITEQRHQGFVSADLMFKLMSGTVNPIDVDYYVCGPPPMMDSIVSGLGERNIDSQRIHFESFGPASIRKRDTSKHSNSDSAHHSVRFHLSENEIKWNSSSGTLLEAAEDAGIPMESGCRSGNCGACLTAVLSGEVDYIDEPGTDVETGSCLPCIAIPKSKLTLNA